MDSVAKDMIIGMLGMFGVLAICFGVPILIMIAKSNRDFKQSSEKTKNPSATMSHSESEKMEVIKKQRWELEEDTKRREQAEMSAEEKYSSYKSELEEKLNRSLKAVEACSALSNVYAIEAKNTSKPKTKNGYVAGAIMGQMFGTVAGVATTLKIQAENESKKIAALQNRLLAAEMAGDFDEQRSKKVSEAKEIAKKIEKLNNRVVHYDNSKKQKIFKNLEFSKYPDIKVDERRNIIIVKTGYSYSIKVDGKQATIDGSLKCEVLSSKGTVVATGYHCAPNDGYNCKNGLWFRCIILNPTTTNLKDEFTFKISPIRLWTYIDKD